MIVNSNLTDFENEIMNKLLNGDDPIFERLRNQFIHAKLTKRELTGVGFYLDFEVPQGIEKLDFLNPFQISDVFFEMTNLKNGGGFILFIANGKLDFLEGYTYGDEKWPEKILDHKLYYISKNNEDRDFEELLSEIRNG